MENQTPEGIELNKKQRVLERLQTKLAESEAELLDFRVELAAFEARYTLEVGGLYAELDNLEARIAEEEARLAPNDTEIQRKAAEARKHADESSAAYEENWQGCNSTSHKATPSPHLKKMYYKLARLIHPDLALAAEERERRHALMAQANDAYATGDENFLSDLLEEHHLNPDLVVGDDIAADLVRAIRQIHQIKRRFELLARERSELENSENNLLRVKVEVEMRAGRNLLSQIAERNKTHIKRAERRLDNLRQNVAVVNADERHGFDVSMFR